MCLNLITYSIISVPFYIILKFILSQFVVTLSLIDQLMILCENIKQNRSDYDRYHNDNKPEKAQC